MTRSWLGSLADAAGKATPGERLQMSGKYMSFDLGETPQVFRSITDADEALILACSPERIRALVEVARAAANIERTCPACGTPMAEFVDLVEALDRLPPDPDRVGTDPWPRGAR